MTRHFPNRGRATRSNVQVPHTGLTDEAIHASSGPRRQPTIWVHDPTAGKEFLRWCDHWPMFSTADEAYHVLTAAQQALDERHRAAQTSARQEGSHR